MANIIQDGSYVLAADTEELKGFEQELESAYLVGEWQIPRRPQPDPGGVPHIWKWDFMVAMMRQAGEVLGLEEGGRRSLLFTNPAIPTKGTTLSLRVGLQMLRPGEVAWAHRHSMGALRFVARGNPKAYTIVDGEKLHMEENDLILTPQQTWHHHENPSDEPVIWLDAIDTPFVRNMNAIFYEQYSSMKQPVVDASDSVQLDAGWTRPRWRSVEAERGLAVAYKWASTFDQLKRLAG
ncbi:MAG: cupin domain-containing protein, partial [Deltaproteobacteria bacterium]